MKKLLKLLLIFLSFLWLNGFKIIVVYVLGDFVDFVRAFAVLLFSLEFVSGSLKIENFLVSLNFRAPHFWIPRVFLACFSYLPVLINEYFEKIWSSAYHVENSRKKSLFDCVLCFYAPLLIFFKLRYISFHLNSIFYVKQTCL